MPSLALSAHLSGRLYRTSQSLELKADTELQAELLAALNAPTAFPDQEAPFLA
jgi:hypothetical protein